MGRSKKSEPLDLTPIGAYHLVVKGELKKFPNGFLNQETCREIMRYVFLDNLHLSREDICNKMNAKFLQKFSVGGFRKKFSHNMGKLIAYCFDDLKIHPWEMKRVDNSFWRDPQNQKDFVVWMAKEENLDLSSLTDVQKITSEMIIKHHGSKAMAAAGGTYELICTATQRRFQEWEILKMDSWTQSKAEEAVRWLIEERLHWDDEQIFNHLTANVFRKNYLGGLLKNYCGNSPIAAINVAYPGRFQTLRHTK